MIQLIKRTNREGKIKLILSIFLFIYSIVVSFVTKNFEGIALAMGCSSVGDILIMSKRGVFGKPFEEGMKGGIVMFAIAHCLYISLMDSKYQKIFFFISMLFLAAIAFINAVDEENKKFETIIMGLYAVCLFSNMINAFFFSILAGIGGILFIISDGILALKEDKDPKWQIAIWATYVPAQICLLTSFLL